MYSPVATEGEGILINEEFRARLDNFFNLNEIRPFVDYLTSSISWLLVLLSLVGHIHLVTESNYSHAITNSCGPLTPQFLDCWVQIKNMESTQSFKTNAFPFFIFHSIEFTQIVRRQLNFIGQMSAYLPSPLFIFVQLSTSLFTLEEEFVYVTDYYSVVRGSTWSNNICEEISHQNIGAFFLYFSRISST